MNAAFQGKADTASVPPALSPRPREHGSGEEAAAGQLWMKNRG
ncbi:MAG: hypothetical protein ACLVKA_09055 [Collinsella aerofaciens]